MNTYPIKSLDEVIEAFIDYRGKTPEKTECGIPLVTAKLIKGGRISEPTEFIAAADYDRWMTRGFPKVGDVVFTTEAPLGEVAQISDASIALAQRVIVMRGKPDILDNSYLMRLLTTPVVVEQLNRRSTGSTVRGIRQKELRKVKIPVPPLLVQKRIAGILDKADGIRCKRREMVAIASRMHSCLFYQDFGDPLFNPKEWDVVELHQVSEKITDGVHFKPQYVSEGIPFVSVKDITTGRLKFGDTKYISAESHAEYIKRCHPQNGDVLLTKVGATYGRPALVDTDRPFSIYVSVAHIKPDRSKIVPVFLKEVLASDELKRQADRAIKGAGVPDLHLVEIRKFKIPLPPLHVQEEFVAKAQAIHALEDKLQTAKQEHNQLFDALVQLAFTGNL